MNESTLESRVHKEISRLFPRIAKTSITHQKYMTLKLGHNNIQIDGSIQSKAFGRLDILVKVEGRPFLVLELKNPGLSLTLDDRDQGISYARLLDPMPPLVVVSNGHLAEFYLTCNKEKWTPSSLDEKGIGQLVLDALSNAAIDIQESITFLLGKAPRIWEDCIVQFSMRQLAGQSGSIDDITRPIATGFSIPRAISNRITTEILANNTKLVALIGPPLTGKTNVAKQVFTRLIENVSVVPLYLNVADASFGLFRQISNLFLRELLGSITPEDVRQWFFGFKRPGSKRVVIIIDGWPAHASDEFRREIEELTSIAKNCDLSILLSVDENLFDEISTIPGRAAKTIIGKMAVVHRIERFSDTEFKKAKKELRRKFNISFRRGIGLNLEIRQPTLLRIVAAEVAAEANKIKTIDGRPATIVISSVTSMGSFSIFEKMLGNVELRSDMDVYAHAIVDGQQNPTRDPLQIGFTYGTGSLPFDDAERAIGVERLNRLLDQGYASRVVGPKGKVFAIPRIPEILSFCATHVISSKAKELLIGGNVESVLDLILDLSKALPLGDIVAAFTIREIGFQYDREVGIMVERLLRLPPRIQNLKSTVLSIQAFDGQDEIQIPFDDDESRMIENSFPWMVLSHLAALIFHDSNGLPLPMLRIISAVGSFEEVLYHPRELGIGHINGFHAHTFPGYGSVLCPQVGVVEPITNSMLHCFYSIPKEMLSLCRWAVKTDKKILAMRLSTAASEVLGSVEEGISSMASESLQVLHAYLGKDLHHSGSPSDEIE